MPGCPGQDLGIFHWAYSNPWPANHQPSLLAYPDQAGGWEGRRTQVLTRGMQPAGLEALRCP